MDLLDKMVKLGIVKVLPTKRGRIGLEFKVGSTNWNRTNKPIRALIHGHYVTSARSTSWVIVVMHRIVITVKKLDTWPKTVRTAIVVGNMAILLEIVLSKENLSRSRVMRQSIP